INDREMRTEAVYDFENSREHIIEWLRHAMRGVCQDAEKTEIIQNLSNDTAYSTFDWGQKILPQKYREPQKDYFGKRVQKGKDICDRIMGVSKSRLRAWESNGHDIQNAVDIKEGFEYAGGIKDAKVAVAQIIDDEGRVLGASNIPNVTIVRSIVYDANGMKIHKASGIGKGKYVPYKNIDFESHMKIIIPFVDSIGSRLSASVKSSQ
ncbi:unnamed protein product, partial [Didymodactylos carnosus]